MKMRIGNTVKWFDPYSKKESVWYVVSFWKKSDDPRFGVQMSLRDSKFVTQYGLSTHLNKKQSLNTPRGYRFVNKEEIL